MPPVGHDRMTFFQTGREKRRPHPNLSPRHAVTTITRDGRGPFEHSGHVKINAERYPVHGALENQSKSGSAGGAISWLPSGPTREQVNDACRTDNEHCLYFCLIAMRAHRSSSDRPTAPPPHVHLRLYLVSQYKFLGHDQQFS